MKNWMMLLTISVLACENVTTEPPDSSILGEKGVYILNEGVWGQNNSTMDFFSTESGDYVSDIATTLWQRPIGDTGNSMTEHHDTVVVAVTSSNKLEWFQLSTGRHIQTTLFTNRTEPRYVVFGEDAYLYVSSFFRHSVLKIHRQTNKLVSEIEVGKFPENMVRSGDYLFVSISDLGKGTEVVVIHLSSFTIHKRIHVGLNPAELILDDSFIYVNCIGDPWDGSPGPRVMILDPITLSVTDSIPLSEPPSALISGPSSPVAFFAEFMIEIKPKPDTLLYPISIKGDIIYTATFNPANSQYWLVSQNGYTTTGWLQGFTRDDQVQAPVSVGINAGSLLVKTR